MFALVTRCWFAILVNMALIAQDSRPAQDLGERVRALVEPLQKRGKIVGAAVGVLRDGATRTFCFGSRAADGKVPVDERTLFEIGSITKAFTGTLLATLVADGTLRLDDEVGKFLPADVAVRTKGRAMTLRDLATHTSGLPRLPDNLDPTDSDPYAKYDEAKLFAFLTSYEPARAPGARYEYSNLGAGLLGTLLARAAGTSYEHLLAARICKPLGLVDTVLRPDADQRSRLAKGHDGKDKPAPEWTFQALAPAGAIRSTVVDLLAFVKANLAPDAPFARSTALARTSHFKSATAELGLGWHFETVAGKTALWHNGGTGGFRSFLAFVPATGCAVVVLVNSTTSVDALGMKLLALLHEQATGASAPTTRR